MRSRTLIVSLLVVGITTAGIIGSRGTDVDAAADDAVLVDLDALGQRTCGLDDDAGVWCWGIGVVPPTGTFTQADAACGITTGGSASCWNGTEAPGGQFVAAAGGTLHGCAITTGGSVSCWGTGPGAAGAPSTGTYEQLDAGPDFTCVIDIGDELTCWGANDHLQASAAPAGPFESVSAGTDHACAIAVGGTVTCWGRTDDGRASPPAGSFVEVAAGDRHSCAIRIDGTAACWGFNGTGQALPPAGVFESIGAGDRHTCGLRSNGVPVCWGDRDVSIAPTGGFADIAAGDRRACAVSSDGRIDCWWSHALFATTPPAGDFTSVELNEGRDACGVRADRSIVCWGEDYGDAQVIAGDFDQVSVGDSFACGLGSDTRLTCWRPSGSTAAPDAAATPTGTFQDISVGGSAACAVRTDTTLTCWDSTGSPDWLAPPTGSFTDVASSSSSACALGLDGSIACWGPGAGRPPVGEFEQIDMGSGSACALRVDRTVVCWNPWDTISDRVSTVPTGQFSTVSIDDQTACGLRPGGRRVCWGTMSALDAPLRFDPSTALLGGPVALHPARLIDTRSGPDSSTVDGVGLGTGRLEAGGTLTIDVGGRGGVPDDASSAMLNVIAVEPDNPGYLTVYACDEPRPQTSNLNYQPAEIVTNAIFSAISDDGDVCIYSLAATDLVVDVNGYTPSGNSPTAIRPIRLLDTRPGPGHTTVDGEMQGIGRLETPHLLQVPTWGRGEIAGGAAAVYINVTVVDPDGPGFVTVFDCGQSNTKSSSVNYFGGDVVTNLVLAPAGKLCFYSLRDTHLVVDAFAYVPSGASPIATPYHRRVLDTRTGSNISTFDGDGVGIGRRPAASTTRVPIASRLDEFDGSEGFMVNVIAVDPEADGFLTVFPCDASRPVASNVNYRRGDITSNAVFAGVDPTGDMCIYTLAETDIVVDVTAYLLPD